MNFNRRQLKVDEHLHIFLVCFSLSWRIYNNFFLRFVDLIHK